MKKFLVFCIVLFLCMLFIQFGYLDRFLIGDNVSYTFKTSGKKIMIKKDNNWEDFIIKGVNLTGAEPGSTPVKNIVSYDTYYNWISQIYNMNANVIRINTLMPVSFYKALYNFNLNKKNPIYILQGIYFNETYLKDGGNPVSKSSKENFENTIRNTIEAVHGHSNVDMSFLEQYKYNISKYIMGYTIGIPWSPGDIIYSQIENENGKNFEGKYFYTEKGASAFENFIAEMANYTEAFEYDKYKDQKLITFNNTQNVISEKEAFEQKEKKYINMGNEQVKPYINPNNIKKTRNLKTGLFISYNFLSQGNLENYKERFDKLVEFNKNPILISEFGYSSSRATISGGISEKQQGNYLVNTFNQILNSKISGGFIYEWTDSWFRSSYNTKNLVQSGNNQYWYNEENYEEHYGLLAFDPGDENSGLNTGASWEKKYEIGKSKKITLLANSNTGYLYLRINGIDEKNLENNYIIIGFKTLSGFGGNIFNGLDLGNKYQFVVKLNNKNGNIYVQRYYDTNKFLNDKFQNQIRPDEIFNKKDSNDFAKEKLLFDINNNKTNIDVSNLIKGNIYEDSKNYNSLADYIVTNNYVEIKIPWGLLNFMNPSKKLVQDDFYKTLSINPIEIDNIQIYLGMYNNEGNLINSIKNSKYKLQEWIFPKFNEREKSSYYIIKNYFGKIGG